MTLQVPFTDKAKVPVGKESHPGVMCRTGKAGLGATGVAVILHKDLTHSCVAVSLGPLGDLGQVTQALCILVSISVKWGD